MGGRYLSQQEGYVSFDNECVPSGCPEGCAVTPRSRPPPHTARASEEDDRTSVVGSILGVLDGVTTRNCAVATLYAYKGLRWNTNLGS